MEPVQEKSRVIRVINFIVVFFSVCLIVGAFFAYRYFKLQGHFDNLVVEEQQSKPMTLELTEEALNSLESSGGIDVKTMNSVLNNMSESDSEFSMSEVKEVLDSLEQI